MPEKAIVDDGDVDLQIFLHQRRQFAHGHLESAIAHHHPDLGLGASDFGADRGRQSEAHRAQSAGSDQRARMLVLVVLRLPHLVLADVGDDNRCCRRASAATNR
jgi:hypothetical protein